MTTALLALVDAVRQMLANIELTSQEGDTDVSRLIETLTRFQDVSAVATDGTPIGYVQRRGHGRR